jgi:DNA-binding PucR family transcriptional regulator
MTAVSQVDRSQFRSLRDVASLINSSGDLHTILNHLVYAACHHAHWNMGGVMSIDQQDGYATVVTRYDPNLLENALEDRWLLSTSPSLQALTRNQPVIIRDAQQSDEFPGYKREAIMRGYRTVVVMPMNCRDEKGRAMVLTLQSLNVVDVTESELAFIETIVHLGAIAIDKAKRIRADRAFTDRLENTLSAHSSLMQQVLSDGSLPSVTHMIGRLLQNPIIAVDQTANQLVADRVPQQVRMTPEEWQAALAGPLGRTVLQAVRSLIDTAPGEVSELRLELDGQFLALPALIERLVVDGDVVGALILFPRDSGFSDLDNLLLDSAKFALSVQMMRSHIRFRSEQQDLSDLLAEIIERRWRDAADIATRARRLGIDVGSPARLIAVDFAQDGTPLTQATFLELHRSLTRIASQVDPDITATSYQNFIVFIAPVTTARAEERIRILQRRIIEEARWVLEATPIVVLSKPFSGAEHYPAAWEECNRMIRLASRLGRRGAFTSRDFGPFSVLLSAADAQEIRAFIDNTIGPIIAYDRENGTAYIETLTRFLDHGCRNQACADAMGLHVTTLRYRLGRLHELFGVEMDTPDRRFTLELAIRLYASLRENGMD